MPNATAPKARGVLAGVLSFLLWGLLPIYWRALRPLPTPQILAHRILWAAASVALLTTVLRGWRSIMQALAAARARWLVVGSACALTANWLVYVWAVNAGYVLQASLGYFITPLLNVTLGTVLLGEPLRRWQRVPIVVATLGVLAMSILFGQVPWIGLGIAITFALYGLFRKLTPLNSLQGLVVETMVLAPFALAFMGWQQTRGSPFFGDGSWRTIALLVACGPISAVPLLLFASAARLLPLSTLGMLQYLSPTCQLLLAVRLYDEPLTQAHMVGFAFIWTALAIYTCEAWVIGRSGGARLNRCAR